MEKWKWIGPALHYGLDVVERSEAEAALAVLRTRILELEQKHCVKCDETEAALAEARAEVERVNSETGMWAKSSEEYRAKLAEAKRVEGRLNAGNMDLIEQRTVLQAKLAAAFGRLTSAVDRIASLEADIKEGHESESLLEADLAEARICTNGEEPCKPLSDLQAKLAAADTGLKEAAGATWKWRQRDQDRRDRIASLVAENARLQRSYEIVKAAADERGDENARLKAHIRYNCYIPDYDAAECPKDCLDYAETGAERKVINSCPLRIPSESSRPPADHDKAHCPAVVHKGEYDRDTCYEDHAVVHVKEYFYTTGMDISGKQWHKVRAHTRRKPKRRRSK